MSAHFVGQSVTLLLVGAVEMFFLTADAEPNVLMNWIVANDVVRPNIVAIGHVAVHVVQSDVIAV
jgi:hypothetical protein